MTATKTAKDQAPVLDLAQQIGEAEAQLEALEVEAEELPAKIQDAGRRGDAETIVAARLRGQDLPLYLSAALVRLLRLRIEQCDLQIAEAEAQLPGLHEAIAPLQEQADEAMNRLRQAQGRHAMRRGDIAVARQNRGQHRLQLDRAIAEGSALPAHIRRPA